MKESLSAMMDAQLSEDEQAHVLTALSRDPELRKTWERYHLIRAALGKELGPVVPTGLSERIAARIRDLPPPAGAGAPATNNRRYAAKWVGSLALAASVAALAIFGAQWLAVPDPQPLPQIARQGDYVRAGTTRWDTDEPEIAKALNVYLVQHNEFTPTSGMNGVFSYVRIVGYDNGP